MNVPAMSKTLEKLEAEITCLVCQGHYKEAKLLPCMHYYCKTCRGVAVGTDGTFYVTCKATSHSIYSKYSCLLHVGSNGETLT